jgi:predicted naringenin-chalcone synthase
MSLAILGIGTALPPTALSRADALAINCRLSRAASDRDSWLPGIYEGTGIRTRYTALGEGPVRDILQGTRDSGSPFLPDMLASNGPTTAVRMQLYAELAPLLAVRATRIALERAGRPTESVTHLITVSCTGFAAPGLDVALLRALGLSPTVQRTHIGFMGCHGAVNGLRVARAFADAEAHACVLLCATELCTLHLHYGCDPQRLVANALFGDGAAAVVGVSGNDAADHAWRVTSTGSCLAPDSADAMTWTIGDHGFAMTLSKSVPRLIARNVRPWLATWLAESELAVEDVASWAVHPGGPRILEAVEEGLCLPRQALQVSRDVFTDCGNMSSPTLLFILDRLRAAGAARPCVALGFGPGLIAEAVLVR